MAGYASPAWSNGVSPALNAANMLELSQAVELAEHPYGVCSTAAATAAKAVTIGFSGTLSLFTGLTVRVKFSNSNTAASPTLNVNGTGAKSIKSYGTTGATTWVAGQVITFVYDGTNWLMAGFDAYTKGQSLSSATAAAMNTAFGNTPNTPDAALALLTQAFSSGLRSETGSYTGTGASSVSITFGVTPMLVIVWEGNYGLNPFTYGGWENSFLWISGQQRAATIKSGYTNSPVEFTLSGKTLSWTISSGAYVLNDSGVTYKYFCIGA